MPLSSLYLTSKDGGDRLRECADSLVGRTAGAAGSLVEVDPGQPRQSLVGFGGAFTEAGGYTLTQLPEAQRDRVIRAYFDPDTGNRYTLCRTHINSCDFALGNYAYNDTPGDFDLDQFDIGRDREYLLPFIHRAREVSGGGFKLFASPWSPPAWMKTNGEMNHGGSLRPECRAVWARYFARYIKAYAAEGVPIWGVTVQNEPCAVQEWDSCVYTHEEQRDFVKNHLGPRLHAEGLDEVKVMVWDHNKDEIVECADVILSDPEAAAFIWGVGFHWYTGDHFENLAAVHRRFPEKKLLFTEGCQEHGVKRGSWALGERYAHSIIGDLNHGAVGWVDWNMLLNEEGGPNHVGNFCDAPIIADTRTGELYVQNAYYYIGHFSRFIRPGARCVSSRVAGGPVEALAVVNPGMATPVVVLLNRTGAPLDCRVELPGEEVTVGLPPRALATLLFDP